ncbi:hypothetical protein WP1_306 [Pseudomonas phage WP1]
MASARAIDAEFAFRMDEFMARVAKEHEALAARLNAENEALWGEIRAVAGLSAIDFPNIAMAHDNSDGKLYVMDADELERVRQSCPCPDCASARAGRMPSQASGGIH